jgi:hypothetical protein
MKPCDCKDSIDTNKLSEQGISINDWHFLVKPNSAIIANRTTEFHIPMSIFKRFSEFYLTDQLPIFYICKCGHEIEFNNNINIEHYPCPKCKRRGQWIKQPF